MAAANVTENKNTGEQGISRVYDITDDGTQRNLWWRLLSSAFDSSTKSILARGRELRTWLLGKAHKEEGELNKLHEGEVESLGGINNGQNNLIERSKEARGVKTGKEIVSDSSPFTGKDIHAGKSDSVKEARKSREQSVTFSNLGDEMNSQSHDKGTAVEGVIFSTLLKYFTLVPKLIKLSCATAINLFAIQSTNRCVVFVVTCQMCYVDQSSTDYGIPPSQCLAR